MNKILSIIPNKWYMAVFWTIFCKFSVICKLYQVKHYKKLSLKLRKLEEQLNIQPKPVSAKDCNPWSTVSVHARGRRFGHLPRA